MFGRERERERKKSLMIKTNINNARKGRIEKETRGGGKREFCEKNKQLY